MNIEFDTIKKSLSRKHHYRVNATNPHHHWRILLVIFGICVVALIVFSLYLFYQIKNDEVFQASPIKSDARPSLVDETLLKKTTDFFTEKAKKEEILKTNPLIVKDPSF